MLNKLHQENIKFKKKLRKALLIDTIREFLQTFQGESTPVPYPGIQSMYSGKFQQRKLP